MIEIDLASPVPIYRQIGEAVRRLIALGELRPGDRFPTVREIAAQAHINRNTAARAVKELERAGIVRTRVGRGTCVADGAPALAREVRDESLDAALDRAVVEAYNLGVPLEELGWRLSKRIEALRRARAVAATKIAAKERGR
jgi:GntR family transcriptional regulator